MDNWVIQVADLPTGEVLVGSDESCPDVGPCCIRANCAREVSPFQYRMTLVIRTRSVIEEIVREYD